MPEVTSVDELFLSGSFLPVPLPLPPFSGAFKSKSATCPKTKGQECRESPTFKASGAVGVCEHKPPTWSH